MQTSLADYAVALAGKHAEYAEAYLEHSTSSFFAVEQGNANGGSYTDKVGIRIRLIKGNRLYTFSTNRLLKEEIRKAVEGFRGFIGFDYGLSKEKPVKAKSIVKARKEPNSKEIPDILISTDKLLRENKFVKYRSLYGGAGKSESYFANSEGSEILAEAPTVSFFTDIIVGNGRETRERIIQLGGLGGAELFPYEKVSGTAMAEARRMLNVIEKGVSLGKSALRGIKNVVVAPEIIGIAVHESTGHPDEADRVFGREAAQAGTSYLKPESLGMRIGSENVTILDNPLVSKANGFYEFDDEGVRSRPKVIVDHGLQKELLLNREYASELGTHSNGSARSDSYSNEPIIRMSNTYVENGRAKPGELFEEARNGVYVKSFTEWNIDDTRSFARYQGNEAYIIKNGSIEKPVKNFKIERSTFDFWHAVKMTANDLELWVGSCGKGEPMQGVPVTMGGPTTLLSFGR